MSIFSPKFCGAIVIVALAAGIGVADDRLTSMTAAIERGDREEASRQGVLGGPATVEKALASATRATVLAGIAAAPMVEGRAELLAALATVTASPDRRIAIPAGRAARTIARQLARARQHDEVPDDLDPADVGTWKALFEAVASNQARHIEVRVLALDTVAALATVTGDAIGYDLTTALADPDPAFRRIAIELVPRPMPAAARAPLALAVTSDADPVIALAAAQVVCGDDPVGARAQLGTHGIDRIKLLTTGKPTRTTRDARRCLAR